MRGGIHFRCADPSSPGTRWGGHRPAHRENKTGYLARYAKLVTSASRGAVLE
nr:hypothetical protein [uncultured Flavonifractor sp.]